MKQITTDPGAVYCVYTSTGCTVTDTATGCTLMTAEPGQPNYFAATGHSVTLSDADATCLRPRFKSAPAALSLLGGGDKLPAGYTRAEFLESTAKKEYIDTLHVPTRSFGYEIKSEIPINGATAREAYFWGCQTRSGADRLWAQLGDTGGVHVGWNTPNLVRIVASGGLRGQRVAINFKGSGVFKLDGETVQTLPSLNFTPVFHFFLYASSYTSNNISDTTMPSRFYSAKLSEETALVRDFIPALDPAGTPCMFDLVSKEPFRNAGSGQFIAGFTLSQARKLGKLPEGTMLTISLPVGYDSDEGVVTALAQAQANGCVLTIQTYESASAVSTFALRRVWVRRQEDANGTYVDADGSRWQVDWCVDIIGADPESLGYERFRSVDAAVAYWELVPYEYPEEELSTIK